MKALTLIQPWAWAILFAGKVIENRSWLPPAKMLGQVIAIHAGQKYDGDAADWIEELTGLEVPDDDQISRGAVVGTAILRGVIKRVDRTTFREVMGPAGFLAELPPAALEFFVGPYGYVLEHVVPVEPFSCRGALGFWDVPETIREHLVPVDAELAEAQGDAYLRGRVSA